MDSLSRPDHSGDEQARVNAEVWAQGSFVSEYASRDLRPAEATFLLRYRDQLAGRTLELGCGAGRLTGYLIDISEEVHGIDISPRMIAYCRRAYPRGRFATMDLREVSSFDAGSFDAVIATYNVLGVLGNSERRRVLGETLSLLRPGGLLMISAHNLAFIPKLRDPTDLRGRNIVRTLGRLALMPSRLRNRRALAAHQRVGVDHAVVNDDAHNYQLLHYYISRDAQERQLHDTGFEFVECLDHEGRLVKRGESASDWVELYYVARKPGARI